MEGRIHFHLSTIPWAGAQRRAGLSDIHNKAGPPAGGIVLHVKPMLRDRLDLMGERMNRRIVGLAPRGGFETSGIDRDLEFGKQHPPQFESGMEFANHVKEKPDRLGTRDRKPLLFIRLNLDKIPGNHREKTASGVHAELLERWGRHMEAEISRVFENLIQRPRIS